MSNNNLASKDIDFPISNQFELPSDQLITLTYEQLQDLIKRAIDQAIQPLQDEIAQLRATVAHQGEEIASLRATVTSVESTQEQDITRVYCDIAYDRQRIAKLEHPPTKEPGKTEISRGEKIERYLAARPDHKATFETLKGHLGIGNDLLSKTITALMDSSPGRYGITKASGDKRKRILVMLPK